MGACHSIAANTRREARGGGCSSTAGTAIGACRCAIGALGTERATRAASCSMPTTTSCPNRCLAAPVATWSLREGAVWMASQRTWTMARQTNVRTSLRALSGQHSRTAASLAQGSWRWTGSGEGANVWERNHFAVFPRRSGAAGGDGGVSTPGPERSLSKVDASWMQKTLSVNLMGPLLLSQALVPMMNTKQ